MPGGFRILLWISLCFSLSFLWIHHSCGTPGPRVVGSCGVAPSVVLDIVMSGGFLLMAAAVQQEMAHPLSRLFSVVVTTLSTISPYVVPVNFDLHYIIVSIMPSLLWDNIIYIDATAIHWCIQHHNSILSILDNKI